MPFLGLGASPPVSSMPPMLNLLSPRGRQQFNESGAAATPPEPPVLSPSASAKYVKHYHDAMTCQRDYFEAEKRLWTIERDGYRQRIAELEGTVQSLRDSAAEIQMSTSHDPKDSTLMGTNGSSCGGPRRGSSNNAGLEEKPPKLNATSKRRLSESFVPDKAIRKLHSILEHNPPTNSKAENKPNKAAMIHKTTIAGADIDKDLDGITFKASAVAPNVLKSVLSSASVSPISSPSRDGGSTHPLSTKPTLSTISGMKNDPYTKDAGHTPMARHMFSGDGTSSGPASGTQTPVDPVQQNQNLEKNKAPVKAPSERRDSYFPDVQPQSESKTEPTLPVRQSISASPHDTPSPDLSEADEDPALTGPLGLTNNEASDADFLAGLDTRLSKEAETLNAAADTQNAGGEGSCASLSAEEEAGEPTLRIKRSLNFGSQLGGSRAL